MLAAEVSDQYDDRRKTVWVGNVESWMDELYIAQVFSFEGAVENVKIHRHHKDMSAYGHGYAFVEFTNARVAKALCERLRGRHYITPDKYNLKVNFATWGIGGMGGGASTAAAGISAVYVGNLDPNVNDFQLMRAFSKKYSSVISAKICVDLNYQVSRGYGFVRFTDTADAQRALSDMNGVLLGHRHITVKPAAVRPSRSQACDEPAGGAKDLQRIEDGLAAMVSAAEQEQASADSWVLVCGLTDVSQMELRSFFSSFGVVLHVQVAPFHWCSGAIHYRDKSSADRAVRHLDGQFLGSGMLRVQLLSSVLSQHPAGHPEGFGGIPAGGSAIINNMTKQNAHALQEQLRSMGIADRMGPEASAKLEHFHMLLQDPGFVHALQQRVDTDRANYAAVQSTISCSCLLEGAFDSPSSALHVQEMNMRFAPGSLAPPCDWEHGETLLEPQAWLGMLTDAIA